MIKKLTSKDFKISNWSGGNTDELYIFPEDSKYKERNFNFRVSIATTESEESTFTFLPNINRFLSILKGELYLEHKGRYSRTLSQFEIENFDGGWVTRAKGRVTDFNLMLKNCKGNLEFKELSQVHNLKIENKKFIVIYCISGSLTIKNFSLEKNEVLIVEDEDVLLSSNDSKIFLIEVHGF